MRVYIYPTWRYDFTARVHDAIRREPRRQVVSDLDNPPISDRNVAYIPWVARTIHNLSVQYKRIYFSHICRVTFFAPLTTSGVTAAAGYIFFCDILYIACSNNTHTHTQRKKRNCIHV